MADNNSSNNVAIVAIIVIIILAVVGFYMYNTPTVTKGTTDSSTSVKVEAPAVTDTGSTGSDSSGDAKSQ